MPASDSSGSSTEQEPKDVNHRRPLVVAGDRGRERAVVVLLVEDRGHDVAAVAPSKACAVASQDVEEAVVLEAGLGVAVPQRLVQPGRALERRLAVERRVDPARELSLAVGKSVRLDAAGAELQPQLCCGQLVGSGQPACGGVALRELDEDRYVVAERALRPCGVDGGDDAARVAGQVVQVAQRDLEPGQLDPELAAQAGRAGDLAGASGDDDRQRGEGIRGARARRCP